MSHRARTRYVLATAAIVAAVLAPAGPASASVVGAVNAWDHQTGNGFVTAFIEAANAWGKGAHMASCSAFKNTAARALTKPYPPDAVLAYHWGAALAFYLAGGTECVEALKDGNAQVLADGSGYISDANTQLGDLATALNALARS